MEKFITKKLKEVFIDRPELLSDDFFQLLNKKYKNEDVVIGRYEFGDTVVKNGELFSEDKPAVISYSDIPLSFVLTGYLEIYTCVKKDNVNSNVTAAVINSTNSFFGVFETCDFFSPILTEKHIPIFKNFQIVAGTKNIVTTVPLTPKILKRFSGCKSFDLLEADDDTIVDCFDVIKSFSKTLDENTYEVLFFTKALIEIIDKEPSLKNYVLVKGWEQSYNLRNDQYNINEIKQGLIKVENNTRAKRKMLNHSVINYIAALYIEVVYVKKGIIPSFVPVDRINECLDNFCDPVSAFQHLLFENRRQFTNHPCLLIPWTLSNNCLSAIHPLHKNTTFAVFPHNDIRDNTDVEGEIKEVTMVIHQLQSFLDPKWRISNFNFYTSISGKNRDMTHAHYKGHFKLSLNNEENIKIEFPDHYEPFKEFALINFK